MTRAASLAPVDHLTDLELLDLYLSLPPALRAESFVTTSQAAQATGLSIRTIQLWIECGAVRAIVIGRRYRICLDSLRSHLASQVHKRDW